MGLVSVASILAIVALIVERYWRFRTDAISLGLVNTFVLSLMMVGVN